jgi:hypothetical protein
MAKTDRELLNSALVDLNETEKRRLKTLLTSQVQKLRVSPSLSNTKKPTPIGLGVTIPTSANKQEQIDSLQRKINQIDQSLKTKQSKDNIILPSEDSPNRAKGGAEYKLTETGETSGLVQYTRPGEDAEFVTGFLIFEDKPVQGPGLAPEKKKLGVSNVVDPAQWNQSVYNKYSQDTEATINMKKRLVELGILPRNTTIDGVPDTAFRTAMASLAAKVSTENFYRIQQDPNQRLLTLDEGLDYVESRGGFGGTATTSRTTISTKDEAYGTLNQALTAYLGREATKEELSQFTAQLNAFERKNPEVSTTTGTSTIASGGATGARERMATEFARSQEGSAAFRAGTYYYDALLDAIDNPLF